MIRAKSALLLFTVYNEKNQFYLRFFLSQFRISGTAKKSWKAVQETKSDSFHINDNQISSEFGHKIPKQQQ